MVFSWHVGGTWNDAFLENMDGKISRTNASQRSKNAVYLIGIQKPKWIWDPVLMSARCALQTAGFILTFHFGLFRVVWLEGFWLASHQLHSVLVVTGWWWVFRLAPSLLQTCQNHIFSCRNPIKYAVSIARCGPTWPIMTPLQIQTTTRDRGVLRWPGGDCGVG